MAEKEKIIGLGDHLLDLSRVGTIILNAAGTLVWVNQAMQTYLGLPQQALIGKNQQQLVADTLANIFEAPDKVARRLLAAHAEPDDARAFECHILPAPGRQERWLEYWSQPIASGQYAGGRIEQYTDITEHKRDKQALAQRNRELALFNRASRIFISSLDLNQVINTILDEVQQLLGVIAYSIWLVDPTSSELVCQKATGPKWKQVTGWQLAHGAGIAGWVVSHGESLIVPDTRLDRRHFKGIDQQIQLEIRSILSVPLKLKNQVIGALQMVDTQIDRFSTVDLDLLESLVATAAIAIENAQLYEQARQDAQTKLVLLHEVNHRVKNNLAMIVGLLYAERRRAGLKNEPIYQKILHDLIGRVQGLATVHNLLSAAEWMPLSLSDLTYEIIHTSLKALPYNKQISVKVEPSPIRVTPKQANHMALVINELITNTVKHALTGRDTARITVLISLDETGPEQAAGNILPTTSRRIRFEYRDDGPGYSDELLQKAGYHVGLYLIQTIVTQDLDGNLTLRNDGGAVTIIHIKPDTEEETDVSI